MLNCERPVDGEPCCECTSCLEVERGVSYDVHELDAASNNGVEAMRDLIEKAQLGTPGRHKVYILDEVHMLSKPAEAALLKTLEEPPSHVVFVLATTDPQKVSDTIRSRTQHLRFHLLGPDTLAEHVRWVADDAGLDIGDEAVAAAVSQGAGSARDTLSALELIASSGGDVAELLRFDEFVEALIEHDPGRALTAMAELVNAGHDPRTIAEEFVKHLRNGFLALMAPETRAAPVGARSTRWPTRPSASGPRRWSAPSSGSARSSSSCATHPIRGCSSRSRSCSSPARCADDHGGADIAALAARVAKLEKALASAAAAAAQAAPIDPSTGRAKLGGRAQRAVAEPARPRGRGRTARPRRCRPSPALGAEATGVRRRHRRRADADADADGDRRRPTPRGSGPRSSGPRLRGLARALFAPVELVGEHDGIVTLVGPQRRPPVQVRRPTRPPSSRRGSTPPAERSPSSGRATPHRLPGSQPVCGSPRPRAPPPRSAATRSGRRRRRPRRARRVPARRRGSRVGLDRVAEAFPGAARIDPPRGRS